MEYKTYKLGTCFSLIENGAIIKQRKEAKGFPITRIETLSHGKFNRDKLGHADIFDTTPYKRYILEDKDLIMSHINSRAFLGRTVLYRKKGNEQIIHGMNVLRIKTNEQFLDPVFASYLFKTSHFKKAIDSIRKDAINQSSINIFDICNIQISLPSITEQRKISHALQLIDKKIETNHLINDNLEAMAKQLYDYWFVQFDFPNEEGKPYKSSGGAMIYNERLKREIPVGWQCCSVNNLCEINKKAISKSEYHHIEYLDTGSITQGHINHTEYYRVDAAPSRAQRKVEDLTIIYSSVRPKLLHYGVLSMPKENFIVSTGFITLDAKNKIMALMVYYFLTSDIVTRYLASIADTAVSSYPSINPEDVAYLDVVLPNKDTIKKFNNIVEPMFRKMSKLRNEIATLTKQRDELLPLLMNGQTMVNYHLSDN
ncbi:restriction endonuclease subunit S [Segatella copri]|uniref:Restriction endonuclease subunit S n=1 Tax=Segatella copri TaxID=165179 RepID=A0AA92TJ60_9BACT|nr:restriction endonuclease subunit S [Segatella copri]